jgi:preprotein translocase subunit SecG
MRDKDMFMVKFTYYVAVILFCLAMVLIINHEIKILLR